MRQRQLDCPLLKTAEGLGVGEQAQGGTGAQGIWGFLVLYLSISLRRDVWEKRGDVLRQVGPVLEDGSGTESWLRDGPRCITSQSHVYDICRMRVLDLLGGCGDRYAFCKAPSTVPGIQ